MGLEKERRVEQDYDSLAIYHGKLNDVDEVEEGTVIKKGDVSL